MPELASSVEVRKGPDALPGEYQTWHLYINGEPFSYYVARGGVSIEMVDEVTANLVVKMPFIYKGKGETLSLPDEYIEQRERDGKTS